MARPRTKPITLSSENLLYSKRQEGSYAICESDWQRLKNKLKSISVPQKWINGIASVCLGAAIACIIELYCEGCNSEEFDYVASPRFIVALIALVIGVAAYIIDYDRGKHVSQNVDSIVEEMNFIESKFTKDIVQHHIDSAGQRDDVLSDGTKKINTAYVDFTK